MAEAIRAESDSATPRRRTEAPSLKGERREGTLVLTVAGDWLSRTVGALEKDLEKTAEANLGSAITMDLSGVGHVDTAGAFVIERLRRQLSQSRSEITLDGLAERNRPLFKAVGDAMDRERPSAKPVETNRLVAAIAGLGEGMVGLKDELVNGLNLIGGAMYGAGRRLSGRTQLRPAAIFNQIDQMGVRAVPIIILITFLVGGIIAQQGAFQLRRFGGEVYAVNLVGILVLREIGVLLTAIMIAGRSSSAICAEIGSMKMREEVDALRTAGIEATVVPGISSALGCAASANVPLTHRDHAQTLTFVTGHAQKGGVPDLDWAGLAKPHQTVVVFMGVGTAEIISEKLREAGLSGETPVAVIENGTRKTEKRAFGQLETLAGLIEARGIKGPALLIIGEVAKLPAEAQKQIIEEALA